MIVSHVMGQSLQKKEAASSAAMASSALAAWAPVAVAYENGASRGSSKSTGVCDGNLNVCRGSWYGRYLATTTGSGGESGGAKIQGYAKGG